MEMISAATLMRTILASSSPALLVWACQPELGQTGAPSWPSSSLNHCGAVFAAAWLALRRRPRRPSGGTARWSAAWRRCSRTSTASPSACRPSGSSTSGSGMPCSSPPAWHRHVTWEGQQRTLPVMREPRARAPLRDPARLRGPGLRRGPPHAASHHADGQRRLGGPKTGTIMPCLARRRTTEPAEHPSSRWPHQHHHGRRRPDRTRHGVAPASCMPVLAAPRQGAQRPGRRCVLGAAAPDLAEQPFPTPAESRTSCSLQRSWTWRRSQTTPFSKPKKGCETSCCRCGAGLRPTAARW
mmetsp:Transcript_25771/g.60850  ORF Transcript_25771/g.60850 Transcript_25771/m.60850 type:complete len:298 (-) Transcript_25771:187-1080(-)